LTLPAGASAGIKGGWLGSTHAYPSEMAQNFWTAIWAWTTCFALTVAISLLTRPTKSAAELKGLVYALTPRAEDEHVAFWKRPEGLGVVVLLLAILLNAVFW
jgi:SSS family solute:Na+ symporter